MSNIAIGVCLVKAMCSSILQTTGKTIYLLLKHQNLLGNHLNEMLPLLISGCALE